MWVTDGKQGGHAYQHYTEYKRAKRKFKNLQQQCITLYLNNIIYTTNLTPLQNSTTGYFGSY